MKIREPEFVRNYMDAVRKELTLFTKYVNRDRKISQIHWGGGTPNSLPSGHIEEVMEQLRMDFDFIPEPEIAIECNPSGLTNEYIDSLYHSGFNRISLGIQDFSKEVLDAVNRDFPERDVYTIVEYIRSRDMKVNLDFIYGLPLQDEGSFRKTIEKAIEIGPDRLVTFSYAHVPWVKPAQKILEKYNLPTPDEKTRMFESAAELLHKAGYRSIGFDHYAREDDELCISLKNRKLHRNFQGYCTRETTGQVYAAGVSSISQLHDSYAQNTKNISRYISLLAENRLPVEKGYQLNAEEIIIRDTINELMCNFYLDPQKILDQCKIGNEEFNAITGFNPEIIKEFYDDNLLEYENGIIEVKEFGKFFIRIIAAAFDPLQKTRGERKFSKSV